MIAPIKQSECGRHVNLLGLLKSKKLKKAQQSKSPQQEAQNVNKSESEVLQPEIVHEPILAALQPQLESETVTSKIKIKPQAKEKNNPIKREQGSWYKRMSKGLSKTSSALGGGLIALFTEHKEIDESLLDELETMLLTADVGIEATERIIKSLTEQRFKTIEAFMQGLKLSLQDILTPVSHPLVIDQTKQPYVILMVGVNGAGKTTTIGKLARYYQTQGKSVMLAAGDTFRAAAVEQLQVWGMRNQVPVIAQHTGADSTSVIFDTVQAAKSRCVDVVIADTAGRLHTKSNLMTELEKIVRVMKKLDNTAPHEIMLVLDAGMGQNTLSQAQKFHEVVGVTGVTLTKLDGTAKGGIVFAIAQSLGVNLRFIGIGEQVDDLRPFDAAEFVNALFAQQED